MSTLIELFELVLKPCIHSYGTGPCSASLGTTGDYPCYNSPATCQSPADFITGEQIVRWVKPSADLPLEIDAIPSLNSLAIRPQQLKPGESLGVREGLNVSFINHAHNDVGFDKYLGQRGFNPLEVGSFWPKFAARWPSLKGFECRAVKGFVGQNLQDMERRYYVVESTSGPDNKGSFALEAKDAITFFDSDKTQAPAPSPGELAEGITNASTGLTLAPAGVGDLGYPASGYASLGDEIVSYTRVGDAVTLGARGLQGTALAAHEAGTTFQQVIMYTNAGAAEIINDLITGYTSTPADYLDYPAWQFEMQANGLMRYSATIPKPTSVKKLLDDLIKEVGLALFTDTAAKKIRVRALGSSAAGLTLTDDHFIKGSVSGSVNEDARISQVILFYNQKNPIKKQDDEGNYATVKNVVYSDARIALEDSPPMIKKIYSRWLKTGGAAELVITRLLTRYSRAPRTITFALPLSLPPRLGDICSIQSRVFQDAQGHTAPASPYFITRVEPRAVDYVVQAEQINQPSAVSQLRVVNITQDTANLNLKDLHDSQHPIARPGDTVHFIIAAGVVLSGGIVYSAEITDPPDSDGDSYRHRDSIYEQDTAAVINSGWSLGVSVILEFKMGAKVHAAGGHGLVREQYNGISIGGGGAGIPAGPGWLGGPATATTGGQWYETFGLGASYKVTRHWAAQKGADAFYTDHPITLINPTLYGGGGGGGSYYSGGDIGQAASAPAGYAINGFSFVTITGAQDLRGPTIN